MASSADAQDEYESLIHEWRTTSSNKAWEALWHRLERLIRSAVVKFGVRDDVTNDLITDVFHKILDKIADYDSQSAKFSTWVVHVTRNHVIDSMRKRKEVMIDDSIIPFLVLGNKSTLVPGTLTDDDRRFVHGYIPFRISAETLSVLADLFFSSGGATSRATLESAAKIMSDAGVAWQGYGSIHDIVQGLWMLIRMAKFNEADWERVEAALSRNAGFGPVTILRSIIGKKHTAWLMLAVGGNPLLLPAPGVFTALLPRRRRSSQ